MSHSRFAEELLREEREILVLQQGATGQAVVRKARACPVPGIVGVGKYILRSTTGGGVVERGGGETDAG